MLKNVFEDIRKKGSFSFEKIIENHTMNDDEFFEFLKFIHLENIPEVRTSTDGSDFIVLEDENIFIEENEEINKILPKIIKYLKNNNKSTAYNIERRRKSGIYYFDNEGIAIFYQKEFNKKIVEKIDISLPYEDNLNISDIGEILNIEILKQIL